MSIVTEAKNILSSGGDFASKVSSATNVASAATGVGKKLGNLLSNEDASPQHIRDLRTNGFLSVNGDSMFKPGYYARAFDEPTYLTFRVEFCFHDPSRNIAYSNLATEQSLGYNYAKMYDFMPEPFLETGWTTSTESYQFFEDDEANPLYGSIGNLYSTSDYLKISQGDIGRSGMLKAFIAGLKDIQNVYPFYFTELKGLSSLSSVNTENGIRLKDAKITLTCNEALDLRITQLLQLYRKIVWDDVYQRWVLPDMMRYFSMKIYVSEIRLFHEMRGNFGDAKDVRTINMSTDLNETRYRADSGKLSKITSALSTASAVSSRFLGTTSTITNTVNNISGVAGSVNQIYEEVLGAYTKLCNNAINSVMPTICYDCHMCEFDITNTMNHLGSLSSTTSKGGSPKPEIVIKVGQVTETQVYPLNAHLKSDANGYNFRASITNSTAAGGIISDDALHTPIRVNYKNVTSANAQAGNADTSNTTSMVTEYLNNVRNAISNDGNEFTMAAMRFGESLGNSIMAATSEDHDLTVNADNPGNQTTISQLAIQGLNELGDNVDGVRESSRATEISDSKKTDIRENFSLNSPAKSETPSRENVYPAKPVLPSEDKFIENIYVTSDKVENNPTHVETAINSGAVTETATNLSEDTIARIKNFELVAAEKVLANLAERIWESPEIQSASDNERTREMIAENVFENAVETIYKSTATENTVMKSLIESYKKVK